MKNTELPFVQDMFDAIAPKYDFLNRALSLRQDVMWRRRTVRNLHLPPTGEALDVACGTGDVALEILRQKPAASVVGVDFAEEMLKIGAEKVQAAGLSDQIHLEPGNALSLGFADNRFDAVTIAFGIRNIKDRSAAMAEFLRCLKPSGRLAILELATPPEGILRQLYLLYFHQLLPKIGGLFSSNFAYQYLPDSVLEFPRPQAFARQMESVGFTDVSWQHLTFGAATLYLGTKPA